MKKTTILIVEVHRLLRQTWSYMLTHHLEYQVVGESDRAEEAIQLASALQHDMIILDINLPGTSGIEALPCMLQSSPHSKILGLSRHNQPAYARSMIKNGTMGYVCKQSSAKELFHALQEISRRKKFICQEVKEIWSRQMISNEEQPPHKALSGRERKVIHYISKGFSSTQIAQNLFLSEKTVAVHRYNILKTLKLRNAAALVNFINKNQLAEIQ